ncbi:MAG: hypothetical protein V1646_03245 [bacterium]
MFAKFKAHEYRRVIFITSAIFYFHGLFCSISGPNFTTQEFTTRELKTQELAITRFSHLPGFNKLLHSGHEGRFFEMESALYILLGRIGCQDILGFDLEIDFFSNSSTVNLGEETILLRTTEFDVVTMDFVIECKSCAAPRGGKSIAQFIKEKDTLRWIRWIARKIKRGTLRISHSFNSKNREKSVFTLSNISKKSHDGVTFSCSWVVGRDAEECIESLKNIINMLSGKELIVFFRNSAGPDFMRTLVENKIDFRENIGLM